MSNLKTMVNATLNSSPAEFSKAFNAEVSSRIGEAINTRRIEVVGNMFGIRESETVDEGIKDIVKAGYEKGKQIGQEVGSGETAHRIEQRVSNAGAHIGGVAGGVAGAAANVAKHTLKKAVSPLKRG